MLVCFCYVMNIVHNKTFIEFIVPYAQINTEYTSVFVFDATWNPLQNKVSWRKRSNFSVFFSFQETYLIRFPKDLCSTKQGEIDYMTILIVVEIILLILVFSKLAYDVRHYNRTGELPWLARHLCLGYSYSGIKSGSGSSAMMNNDWYHHQDHLQDFQNQGILWFHR